MLFLTRTISIIDEMSLQTDTAGGVTWWIIIIMNELNPFVLSYV